MFFFVLFKQKTASDIRISDWSSDVCSSDLESVRLAVMATGLQAIGARVQESEDGLVIDGTGGDLLPGGATIAGHLDHRICMSFAVAGLVSKAPVTIDDIAPVATSFHNFEVLLAGLQR